MQDARVGKDYFAEIFVLLCILVMKKFGLFHQQLFFLVDMLAQFSSSNDGSINGGVVFCASVMVQMQSDKA